MTARYVNCGQEGEGGGIEGESKPTRFFFENMLLLFDLKCLIVWCHTGLAVTWVDWFTLYISDAAWCCVCHSTPVEPCLSTSTQNLFLSSLVVPRLLELLHLSADSFFKCYDVSPSCPVRLRGKFQIVLLSFQDNTTLGLTPFVLDAVWKHFCVICNKKSVMHSCVKMPILFAF